MLKTAKVVGLNSDTDAALALSVIEGELGLFLIAACSLEDAFSRIRLALSEAEDLFHSSSQSVSGRLPEILESVKKSLQDASDLEILAAVTQGDQAGSVLYLQCQGSSLLAYLLRGNSHTDLCGMSEGQLVSGILQPGDRVVLSTKSLVELLGGEIGVFGSFPISNLEDEVAAHLPEAESYPVAALVIEEEPLKPEESEISEIASEDEEKVISGRALSFNAGIFALGLANILKKVTQRIIPRSKKGIAIVVVGLVLAVSVGVFSNQRSNKETGVRLSFEQKFNLAVDELNKAESLKESDTVSALQSFNNAKKAVEEALNIKPEDGRAIDLKAKLAGMSGDILKIYKIDNFPLWLDLDLIKKGLNAEKLSFSLGNILILDDDMASLVEIGVAGKSQQALAGEDKLGEAKLASLNGEIAWVYSEDKGLVRIDTKSKEAKVAVKKDDEWGEISEVFGFASNVYLLDSGKSSIWKYVPVVAGYSDRQSYFKEGVKADLSDVKRLQIDSSVWILRGNGEILKYTQGSSDFFSLSGLDKPINNPKSFFVSDKTENLYLLDSGNSRLVVMDKRGNYKSQYQSDRFGIFSDLVVDEKGKKVYLLDSNKIFLLDLR